MFRPGILLIAPHMTTNSPAPTLAYTSLTGMVNPVGAPFLVGSAESER